MIRRIPLKFWVEDQKRTSLYASEPSEFFMRRNQWVKENPNDFLKFYEINLLSSSFLGYSFHF